MPVLLAESDLAAQIVMIAARAVYDLSEQTLPDHI